MAIAAGVAAGALFAAAARAQADVNTFELEVISIVNSEREALGVPPLGTDVRLFSAIEGHTEWMAQQDTLSHTGEGGSNVGTRVTAQGYEWTAVGEVLAAGQETPHEVVLGRPCDQWCSTACVAGGCDGWRQSAGHWNILMSSAYRDIGVAYVADADPQPFRDWWGANLGNSVSEPTPVGDAPTATSTTVPTATSTATTAPSPTATATPQPTATSTTPPTATATRTPPPATATHTPPPPTSTDTAVPPSPTAAASATLLPSPTATSAASATRLPTATSTATATSTPLPTATPRPSSTPLPSATPVSPTATDQSSSTPAPSATPPPPSATPRATATSGAGGAGSLIVGRVRLQAFGSWEGVDVTLDGIWRTTTSPDGWIVILDVQPGIHVLEATKTGYLSSRRSVVVEAGRVALAGETLLLGGDAFPDDVVDSIDLIMVQAAFGRCVGEPNYQRWIDVDGSGCVDDLDLVAVEENFGRRGPTAWVPIPVSP